MSFMFKPYPYDDLSAINKLKLEKSILDSISCGMRETIEYFSVLINEKLASSGNKCIIAIDGYPGVEFEQLIEKIQEKFIGNTEFKSYSTSDLYKPASVLEQELAQYLPQDRVKDPVLLFGSLYKGGYEGLFDNEKIRSLQEKLENFKSENQGNTNENSNENSFESNLSNNLENSKKNNQGIFIVYGYGCLINQLRAYYDIKVYIDMTPLRAILKARKDNYRNIGDYGNSIRPLKEKLRRCYYVDFECALKLRKELWKENVPDLYIVGDETCVINTKIDAKTNDKTETDSRTYTETYAKTVNTGNGMNDNAIEANKGNDNTNDGYDKVNRNYWM
jgi:mannose-6-phosphate isomerase